MKQLKVVALVGCRSDEGLSFPIILELQESAVFNPVHVINLFTNGSPSRNFKESYEIMDHVCSSIEPDLVICVGDRVEMCAAAAAAFHNGVKIAHVYAGTVADADKVTLDEVDKHCVSLWADICFCEDYKTARNVAKLWLVKKPDAYVKGELEQNGIFIVGITHLDRVEIDESLVPPCEYDLVCYNFPIVDEQIIEEDIHEIECLLDPERNAVFIGSNPDQKRDLKNFYGSDFSYKNVTHGQMLGLLKRCQRVIGNSSLMYYEAPFFLKEEQIVWVGLRNNRRREYKRLETGASVKIVKILEKWASPQIIIK